VTARGLRIAGHPVDITPGAGLTGLPPGLCVQ
jgi:hypothetical protein